MKILRDSSPASLMAGACLALFVAVSCSSGSSTNNGGSGSGGSEAGSTGSKGGSGGSKTTGKTGGTSGASCTKLEPIAGMDPVPALIMSEIRPGESIEVYNTTTKAIDLAVAPKWYLCAFPLYLLDDISSLTDKTSIPAGGSIKLTWPATWLDTDKVTPVPGVAKGEMLLYTGRTIPANNNDLKDYVCWGTHTGGRKDKANAINAEDAKIWSGDCVAAPTNGSIARKVGTNGESKDSYDPAADDGVKDCP
jgi:hypothetical protein